jgi:phage tail tube protein FII
MSATIYNLDTANLFVGDDNPDNSQFLTLNGAKVPMLEESTRTITPGGGIVAMDIGMRKITISPFTFKLNGINPDVMPKFMTNRRIKYTLRGNVSNVRTQEDIPLLAVVEGRMIKVDIGEFRKDTEVDTDYEIREIAYYMLKLGDQEKYYLDVFAGPNGVRIDGNPIFRDVARNIGLGV